MRLSALLLALVHVATWAQGPQRSPASQVVANRPHNCTCTAGLNPTNNVVPVRSGATFVDSRLSRDVNGNLQVGTNPTPNVANGGLTMVGTLTRSNTLEVHNNYAVGIDLFTHADAQFRAPFVNFYRSRGKQTAPTPVQFAGYEASGLGGINFGGWNGSSYFAGSAAIYVFSDEVWTPTAVGGHLSIYGTNKGGVNTQEIAQFGGLDPTSLGGTNNIIFMRPLAFNGNQFGNPALFPASNPAVLHVRSGDNSRDASLTALNVAAASYNATNLLVSSTGPTISSGFGVSPSIETNNGSAAFTLNVGTGGTATSGVIGLPTAASGWNCFCTDITTNSATVFSCKQTASSTTTATLGNFNTAAAAAAWTDSDVLSVSCFAR
jgi:hypothetical protein